MRESSDRRWIEAWKAAGPELKSMKAERAFFLSDAVLHLVRAEDVPERRRKHSGLADLQAVFGRLGTL